jgi:TM2 domain-containing membrane protein YozV
MSFVLSDFGFTLGLFIAMLLCFDLGRRFGVGRLSLDPDGVTKGSGPVEAAVFGLLGLLLAFTFSGAAARFEERRFLIATEANEISTAYQRVDLLPESAQPEIRELFRRYLETRIVVYRDAANEALTASRVDDTVALQVLLWEKALAATADPTARAAAAMLLLPSLNDMFDIAATRAAAMDDHPPAIIFVLLVCLSLMASMLAGYVLCVGKGRNWFYMLLFSTTISLTLYVIIDMEYPRYGLIRVDAADQTLIDLREPMQ